ALGLRDLAGAGPVAVGRTETHVALRVGPWTFCLTIDATSRLPDARAPLPAPRAVPAHLRPDPAGAGLFAPPLPQLPGRARARPPAGAAGGRHAEGHGRRDRGTSRAPLDTGDGRGRGPGPLPAGGAPPRRAGDRDRGTDCRGGRPAPRATRRERPAGALGRGP